LVYFRKEKSGSHARHPKKFERVNGVTAAGMYGVQCSKSRLCTRKIKLLVIALKCHD
jgi:hypothetical protein